MTFGAPESLKLVLTKSEKEKGSKRSVEVCCNGMSSLRSTERLSEEIVIHQKLKIKQITRFSFTNTREKPNKI